MADFFEFAPASITEFTDRVQEVLTTIPMRFSVLSSDMHDDGEHSEMVGREFIFNEKDPSYRLLSQSLRYQSNLDALGLEKLLWIEEVYRKFNVLSLLNFVFREYLSTFFCPDEELKGEADVTQQEEAKLNKQKTTQNQNSEPCRRRKISAGTSAPMPVSMLTLKDLQALEGQYVLKKHSQIFDVLLVDTLIFKKARGLFP